MKDYTIHNTVIEEICMSEHSSALLYSLSLLSEHDLFLLVNPP